MTVVVAEDRSMCLQPNQVVRTAWVDTDPCRSASSEKAGRNLYGAFIEQNVNASRILIVESAFDPRNPTRARRAGASEPGTTRGYGHPGFWVDLICIEATRLGVHSKAQGLQDLLR